MQYIPRKLFDELLKWLERREILAIRGPRQSGKTTLLEYLRDYIKKKTEGLQENIILLSFEDKELVFNFSKDPEGFINAYMEPNRKDRYYFLLDEFQYIHDGGQKLKLLYDTMKNIKFIITGSSSLELTDNTTKYLVGRIFLFNLYQFDFEEYLFNQPKNIINLYKENSSSISAFILKGEKVKKFSSIFNETFKNIFEGYCIFGGYPEIVKAKTIEEKEIILKNIYNTYIEKDIIGSLKLEDDYNFRNIITILANQTGSVLNSQNLIKDGLTYFKKLKQYLFILEETYIIKRVKPYFKSKSSEIRKNPKLYFIDNGLRNSVIKNFNSFILRGDAGAMVENVVFSQIFKNMDPDIRYWRTIHEAEVDFLIKAGSDLIPVEVKYTTFSSPKPGRSFINFIKKYNPPRGLILTKGYWGEIKIDNTEVLFAPVWFI
ncbi:MAG: ATP-binding protein [Actinobacteria bacterium]|nr:ATP-binding protein [Actinomycetota bacterium]